MAGEVVIRVRAGASTSQDRYGNPLPGPNAEWPIDGARVGWGASREDVQAGRFPVVSDLNVFFPHAEPDLTATDQVQVRGGLYEVIGDPFSWRGAIAGGTVVQLRKVDG